MADHIPMFTLRLSSGRTIGHDTLRSIWQRASLSRDVSVTRTLFDRHVPVYCAYTLSGTRGIEDLRSVEGRLRSLILAEITGAQVMLTRLV
jgi:hypothetical protein